MEIVQITDVELLVRMRFDYFANDGHLPAGDRETIENSLREYFQKQTGEHFVALAVKEGDQIVSVGYMVINEMPANGAAPNGLTGTLLNILTYPEHRGYGYGTALIEALKDEARKRNLCFIDLYATEQGGPLYEKAGFKKLPYNAMRLML